ncbi:hypothetical protein NA56DRAFT_705100 [Hyaloscypha hepaticicola]|uniref:Uncharacterized protein n=1 Tax=Hyaloscypha hepaticicola TaxID=2082293 RepID=A0A2J6Q0P7_9HELO|nr:hypothetical protein NA56DRAFT_705100 [Hyaloscypha hepaticicola]
MAGELHTYKTGHQNIGPGRKHAVLSRAIALLGMCSLNPKPCVSTIYQALTPRPSSTTHELSSPRSPGPSIPEGGFPPLGCTFSFLLTIHTNGNIFHIFYLEDEISASAGMRCSPSRPNTSSPLHQYSIENRVHCVPKRRRQAYFVSLPSRANHPNR